MNIIFFGSSRFGYPALKGLIEACYPVSLVVTQPDKQKGRGLKLGATQIKELAETARLRLFQPEDVNSPDSARILAKLKPDLFVIIAYGQKFSPELLAIPRIMPVNVHASLLPKYRGAAPINWAVINGEKKTGNTVMKVIPRMDAGPIILQSEITIEPGDDSLSLEEKLSFDSGISLLKAVKLIEEKEYPLIEQDEKLASSAPKLNSRIARIDWREPAEKLHNLARGCLSWTAASSVYKGKLLKIYLTGFRGSPSSRPEPDCGKILEVSPEGLVVACGGGELVIRELQIEGKNRLSCREFLAGNKIAVGDKLG